MSTSWFNTFLYFFLLTFISTTNSSSTPTPTVSYADHCSSFVPESSPTNSVHRNTIPRLLTSSFTGGDQLIGRKQQNETYYYVGKSIRLRIRPYYYETIADGVYKVDGYLSIQSPYQHYHNQSNYSYVGSHGFSSRAQESIRFLLTGFWSEVTRKLCMVGSAFPRKVDGIRTVNLDAVLKLNFASEKPTIYTGVVSGSLESLSSVNDQGYFDTILMYSFPDLSNYSYSMVSNEVVKNRSFGPQPIRLCMMFSSVLEMECGGSKYCSSVGFSSARFLAFNTIQCSGGEKKLRFMVKLQNMSYFDQEFSPESTLIGEASWDDKNNEVSGVACRLLNPVDHSGNGVGDCTMRLSLKYNSVWTIRNEPKVVGHFWSTRNESDSEYFRKINLTSYDLVAFPDLRYEYSELERAKKLCPVKKPVKKGNVYPDGHSYDMRFDMTVKNPKGQRIGWAYATPISVENDLYNRDNMVFAVDSMAPQSVSEFATAQSVNFSPSNISYKISIHSRSNARFGDGFPNHNVSTIFRRRLDITAEGVYNAENGYLCMVGCGKSVFYGLNSTDTYTDCEILVKLEFAPLNDNKGGHIKGTIESMREKSDPLHFEDLSLLSSAYYGEVAERSIWRMDFEITMVLISNTLSCIFIALQIFHVKRKPEALSCVSLFMLLVLSLGHMFPLVLNFEAVFLENHNKQTLFVSSGGWLEANEVAVRVITMVAFLLQIRLVQLVWTAKWSENNEKSSWVGEKKSIFITLPLYILGGLLAFLLNLARNRKYSLWGDLRSYAGLILDGFVLPQILLNVFIGSAEKALSEPFYVGTSVVRLVPHAYNQYRVHNYPTFDVNGTYYYANPAIDYYSTAWDVLIPCGVIFMAVIVFLQQRNGGRCIIPRRFRELELYQKVPAVINE